MQRVTHASVKVDGETIGEIGNGFLILLGVAEEDNEAAADKMADKICRLRIFQDGDGKTNLSLADVGGELLVVSQFTLYADCHKGNRPSFIKEHGSFGADMKVELLNDGPFTLMLEGDEKGIR